MSLPVWARDASNRCLLRMVANVVYADRLEALEACRRCPAALRIAGRCPKPKLRDLEQPNAALTSGFAGSRVGGTGYFRVSGIGAPSSSKARRCVGVLVEDAAAPISSADVQPGEVVQIGDRFRQGLKGPSIGDALVWSVRVVERLVLRASRNARAGPTGQCVAARAWAGVIPRRGGGRSRRGASAGPCPDAPATQAPAAGAAGASSAGQQEAPDRPVGTGPSARQADAATRRSGGAAPGSRHPCHNHNRAAAAAARRRW